MVGLMKRYIRLGCWGMSCTKGWEYCITGFGKQWDRFTGAPNKGKNINHYISFNFLRSSITLHPALKCIGLCCKMCLHNMSLSKIWESTHLNKWELIMFKKKTVCHGIFIQNKAVVAVALSFWSWYVKLNE